MRKKTGTIINIIDDKAAIMTKECEILYIKKQPGMYLGLEIQFGANEIISNKNKLNLAVKIVSSVAAIFLFIFLNLHFFHKNDNYTYVCIDGKSSIEFTIDNDMKVVKATGIDKESQENLKKIDLKSKSLKIALSAVLNNNIIQDDYTSDDCIIISAYAKYKNDDQNNVNKNIEKALLACKDSVYELDNVDFRFVGIDNNARKLAVENNISMGRYYIFERAQEQGKNISLEQVKDMKVGELVKKVNIPYLAVANDEEKAKTMPDNIDNKNLPEVIDTKDAHTKKVHPTPIVPKADGKKVPPTPIVPKTEEKKEPSTPIVPKAEEKKEPPTPIPPKANEIKVHTTPVLPKVDEKKVPPSPILPKAEEGKVSATPVIPKADEVKVSVTPVIPKADKVKVSATPVIPKTDEVKVSAAPVIPKTDEVKVPTTPILPKVDDKKVPPTPVIPKADEGKVSATPVVPKADEGKVSTTPVMPKADEGKVPTPPVPPKADEGKVYPTPPVPSKEDEGKVPPTPIPLKTDEIKAPSKQ